MSRSLTNLSERQILKAQAEGTLDNLEGQGQPLPDRPGDAYVDPGLAAGMRIMAQAGVKPEEFGLKSDLDNARRAYQSLTKPAERKAAMARISDLELRYNLARDARKRFFR